MSMTSSSGHDDLSSHLKGLGILLVEDSPDVGEAVKAMLSSLGADVVGPAATTAEAERLLLDHALDVALVDFHLRGGEVSSALIARLHEQGVPVIITSGSEMDFLPSVKITTILEKPFSELQLLAILYPLIARKGRAVVEHEELP
jgi:DNA-binding response OmpR family regulator